MQPSIDFRNTHICIATPCYGSAVFQNYMLSIIKLIYVAEQHGIRLSFIVRGGDSLIPRSRNSIVAEFLATPEYTHLFWIDADIGFEPNSVIRLLSSGYEVVSGVYPMKKYQFPDQFPGGTGAEQIPTHYTPYPFNPIGHTFEMRNGFIEVLDAPTGFMMIRREALEKMMKAYPNDTYVADYMPGLDEIADKIAPYHYTFFDVMVDPDTKRYLSEDYAFCRRWQKIGGKMYVDAECNLTHMGLNTYQGNFFGMLMARAVSHDPIPDGAAPPPPRPPQPPMPTASILPPPLPIDLPKV